GRDAEFGQRADAKEAVHVIVIAHGARQGQQIARHSSFNYVEAGDDKGNIARGQFRHEIFTLQVLAIEHSHGAITRAAFCAQAGNFFSNDGRFTLMRVTDDDLDGFVKDKASAFTVAAVAAGLKLCALEVDTLTQRLH